MGQLAHPLCMCIEQYNTSKIELIKYSDNISIQNKVKNNLKNTRKMLDKTKDTCYIKDTNKERQNK